MPDLSLMGDAVHNVLVHLHTKPLGLTEPFEPRLKELEDTTPHWHTFPADYQARIRLHWHFIAGLYTDARSVWLEAEGQKGLCPDMTRRLAEEYQVLEFKTSDTHSLNQKSRQQVRDMMAKLRQTLGPKVIITGHRIYLPLNLEEPPTPLWHEIQENPA